MDNGTWQVTVTRYMDSLEVIIMIANDINFQDIMFQSGTDFGHFPDIDFNITEGRNIYIRVQESSVYSDSHGFYDIGVYSAETSTNSDPGVDLTTTVTSTTTETSNVFFPGIASDIPLTMITIFSVSALLIIGFGGAMMFRNRSAISRGFKQSFVTQPPAFVIPERHQLKAQQDGAEIRTVRVPTTCPTCNATLTTATLNWVGPLEASCTYCGATIQASLEKM